MSDNYLPQNFKHLKLYFWEQDDTFLEGDGQVHNVGVLGSALIRRIEALETALDQAITLMKEVEPGTPPFNIIATEPLEVVLNDQLNY